MKKQSKHKGSRKRYASYPDQVRRMLVGTYIQMSGSLDIEPQIRFSASVDLSKADALQSFMVATPNRWDITARAHVRYADGTMRIEESRGKTGQALKFDETEAVREELMRQATSGVNPKYVEDKTFIMRIAR